MLADGSLPLVDKVYVKWRYQLAVCGEPALLSCIAVALTGTLHPVVHPCPHMSLPVVLTFNSTANGVL